MAGRTETVDNNESITIGRNSAKLSGKLLLPAGISNSILFSEAVKNPEKLRQGFGLRTPPSLTARFQPGMSVPSLELLPYLEQDDIRKGSPQRGLRVTGRVTSIAVDPSDPSGNIVWIGPQSIIAVLIAL